MCAAICDVSIGGGVVGELVVATVGRWGHYHWVVDGVVGQWVFAMGCVWVSEIVLGSGWGRGPESRGCG